MFVPLCMHMCASLHAHVHMPQALASAPCIMHWHLLWSSLLLLHGFAHHTPRVG